MTRQEYRTKISELELATEVYYGYPELPEYMNDIEFDATLREVRDYEERHKDVKADFTTEVGTSKGLTYYTLSGKEVLARNVSSGLMLIHNERALKYCLHNKHKLKGLPHKVWM